MRLVGREKLLHLSGHDQAGRWITHWTAEVRAANWKQAAEVSVQFPHVRLIGINEFMFPVSTLDYAIRLLVAYPQGIAVITNVVAFNHAS